ncbi:hypothetical protein E2P81_ATG01679 [Venturia nashicola]|uniref:Xylanolytic transcriptional activator regulatory domain-containing protein n=1 Tax=Venturia nashicola TaxID=86259 RepID=A0A4Z1NSZ7_9PEZI|nr:hypothetical protein E6O75_ATG01723 [Venturia nashicola]TLD18951.1 hypothetical protein E2P81_ATG01679 [Venturia nashicola]
MKSDRPGGSRPLVPKVVARGASPSTIKDESDTAETKTKCSYDPEAYEAARRKTPSSASKRDFSALIYSNTEYLLSKLRLLPEEEAQNLFWLIRTEPNNDTIADALLKSSQNTKNIDLVVAEADSSTQISGDPSAGQTFCYGHTSQLGLAEKDTEYNPQKAQLSPDSGELSTWTDVTKDVHLIDYLLKLYFTWSNKFFPVVREKEFYHDFKRYQTHYCSPTLVNAMCSYACHFTDDPAARKDPNNPRTAGDHFFEKAQQLLYDSRETSCFTTVQALAIMSIREPSAGRDSSGYKFHGRAIRMALELGMHLKHDREPTAEDRIRQETMWFLFILETAWSVCIGRVSQLPREAIAIDLPRDVRSNDTWQALNDESRYSHSAILRCDDAQLLHHFVKLSVIVGELMTMFYAPPPRTRMTSGRVRSFYQQLKGWYKTLPPFLRLSDHVPPHIYILHMYYWTCMIHLFRPLVRLELDDGLPVIRCREVAIEAAVQVVKISADYRRLFPTRTVVIFWTHVLLSSGTLLLLDLPAKNRPVEGFTTANRHAFRHIGQILEHLAEMSANHQFATRCAGIIRGRAVEMGLMLPDIEPTNLHRQLYNATPTQSTYPKPSPICNQAFGFMADESQSLKAKNFPVHIPEQPRPKTAFRSQPAVTAVAHILEESVPDFQQPFVSYPPHPTIPQTSYNPSVPLTDPSLTLFWSPDGSGLPLYNMNINTSPMSVVNMMDPVPMTDAVVRDGFKISDLWGHDPFGAHGTVRPHMMMQQGPIDTQQLPYQQQYF